MATLFYYHEDWKIKDVLLDAPNLLDEQDFKSYFANKDIWTRDIKRQIYVRNTLGVALVSGTLEAAGIAKRTGALVPLPPEAWRVVPYFGNPSAKEAIDCAFAGLHVEIPGKSIQRDPCLPIISLHALAVAFEAASPPPRPKLVAGADVIVSGSQSDTQNPDRKGDRAPQQTATAEYSKAALGAWFTLRVSTWRKGEALPTEADDHAAAKSAFGDFPRDDFREVRRSKVPVSWRKPGPRKSRG